MKGTTRRMRNLVLATVLIGLAVPAAQARRSHLVTATRHVAARAPSLPPAAFPKPPTDPAGLALLLNPDALTAAEAADDLSGAAARPPIALANLDQLRAPPIAEPEPPAPPLPPVTRGELLAAAGPPPIFVHPSAAITVFAPPVMLGQATPFPIPPPPPVVAVAPPPVRMALLAPPPPRAAPPPRRIARRVVSTPVRAQLLLRPPPHVRYDPRYEPQYEPPPQPYGVLIGPPRGYGYGYWGGYGTY